MSSAAMRVREAVLSWVGVLLVAACAAVVVARMSPPEVVPRGASPALFSAARAWQHLEQIAQAPHPSGSPAAREVERHIAGALEALGLRVDVQSGPACVEAAGMVRCAHVRNLLATLPGRGRSGALLLSAHYDSVPNAPGAGDDGAAVAALIEVARALAREAPPERDVMFAFLDAEEDLLLGAAALCRSGRLERVELVANFDARGSRGVSTLVGTSLGSAGAVSALLASAEHPVLSSFYPTVARVLPNATDADIYELCGKHTLSFAFAEGFEHYHQSTDDLARLDPRTLQHHGSYALGLARRVGQGVDALARGGQLVYFDVARLGVVRYSHGLARVLAAALALATLSFTVRRARAGAFTRRGLVLAALAFVLLLLAAAALGALVVEVVARGFWPWAAYLHAHELAACAAGLWLALGVAAAAFARRRGAEELATFGPLLVWVALAGLTAAFAPGTSFLFTWPAAALLAAALAQPRTALGKLVKHHAPAAIAAVLLAPVVYALLVVVGEPGVAGAAACVALAFGAWPTLLLRASRRAKAFGALALLASVAIAVALQLRARGEPRVPLANTIGYAIDTAGQAFWFSSDEAPDPWTRQFLGPAPVRASLPALPGGGRLLAPAPLPPSALAAPTLELVSDEWSGARRELRLRARSPRRARQIELWEPSGIELSTRRFDGAEPLALVRFSPALDRTLFRLFTGNRDPIRWSIALVSPLPDGSLLSLSTEHAGPLELRVADRSEGLAVVPAKAEPRPHDRREGHPGDHTLIAGAPLRIAAHPRP